ncbi:M10 family metallopeptidase C-terminal domain-containing protein [Marinomonas gallaica]|uniref:M10 family metallopeptidase C-terminal domain-containing protein n=1 Tax=Marinomonas gallaica TaxID=1806667 RepID=UPI003CE5872D
MTKLNTLLDQYGISFNEARTFVYSNFASPHVIYDTAGRYDISFSMLAELYGQDVNEIQVKQFFSQLGFDTSDSIPQSDVTAFFPNMNSVLDVKSVTKTSVSAFSDRTTPHIESVLTQEDWDWSTVTYNFPTSIPDSHKEDYETSFGWRPLNDVEKASFIDTANRLNQYIVVELEQISDFYQADIQVVAVTQLSAEAFAYLPDFGIGGDIFLNADGMVNDPNYYSFGGYGISTMAHELGHAMGGEHTFEGDSVLPAEFDNTYFSIMTYTETGFLEVEAQASEYDYSVMAIDNYRSELGIIDVAALQYAYGADMSTNSDDDVYVYNEESRSFETSSEHYLTIWDAGGVDTIDVSDASFGSVVNLNDYTLSSVSERTTYEEALEVAAAAGLGSFDEVSFIEDFIVSLGEEAFLNQNNLGIAFGVVIENVVAGAGDDVIIDNEVDNLIYSGAGDDAIYLGAGGYDQIDGGVGNDTVFIAEAYKSIERYVDNNGYHIVGDNFAATLIGVETVQYSDTSESIA